MKWKTILWNAAAFVAAFFLGSVVNITLVNIGPSIIPMPDGADVSTMEKLRESMNLFRPANFLFPFLGHALGTFVGALVAARLAASHGMLLGLGIGGLFLAGGIAAIAMLGGPLWFQAVDLIVAYLPMAYLGATLGGARLSPDLLARRRVMS